MKKEIALSFASLGIVLSLVVGLGELTLRLRYGGTSLPKEVGGGYPAHLMMPDEKMGYTLTPGFRGRQLVPDHPDVELQINRKGLRDYERRLPPSAESIFVLGDSFTFGHGVAFEKIWPTLLENKIRERDSRYFVIKTGVPGFSWHQYEQQYQRLAHEFPHHSLVIVGFTVDAGERVARGYELKGGVLVKRFYPHLMVLDGLVYEKPFRNEWLNQADAFLRSHSYFFRWFNQRFFFVLHRLKRALRERLRPPPRERNLIEKEKTVSPLLPLSRQPHIQEAVAVLDSIWKLARTKEAKMLVLFIRHPQAWENEVRFYQAALSERGIPYLDLSARDETSYLSWLLPKDWHWNELGNQEVARLVYQFIREHKLLESVN